MVTRPTIYLGPASKCPRFIPWNARKAGYSAGVAHAGFLPLQQLFFALNPPAVPPEPAAAANNPMARNENRNIIGAAGGSHGANGVRRADFRGQLSVCASFTPRNPLQRVPHTLLKG